MNGRFFPATRLLWPVLILVLMQSCASQKVRSNDETLADLSGKQVVLSLQADQVDMNLLQGNKSPDTSILRLVREQDYAAAFRDNGRRTGSPLAIRDPSSAINTSLVNFFSKKFQLKTVAKGTIKNIDPAFLNRALKQGELVMDVRLTELMLLPSGTAGLYYLQAEYQFSVIDHRNTQVMIADRCAFNDKNAPQTIAYYATQRGANISNFLIKHANDCLSYFAKGSGSAKPATAKSSAEPKPAKTQRSATVRESTDGSIALLLGTAQTYYPRNGADALFRNSYVGGLELRKPLGDRNDLTVQLTTLAENTGPAADYGFGSSYGAQLAVGTTLHSRNNPALGIKFLARGQIGQYLQNGNYLGTNALSAEVHGFIPLFGPLSLDAGYAWVQHIGEATSARETGHQVQLELIYRLR